MKKLYLVMALMLSFGLQAGTSVLEFYPEDFKQGDGFSAIGSVAGTGAPYYAAPTGMSGTVLAFGAAVGVSASVMLTTPDNLIPGKGAMKVEALCHLSAATNTARVTVDFQQQGVPNGLTNTAVWTGIGSGDIPATASTSLRYIDAKANTIVSVDRGRLINLVVKRSAGTNSVLEIFKIRVTFRTR